MFIRPSYAPELNAVEFLWAHVKRTPASVALDQLEAAVRNPLKRLQYRPHVLDGFLAKTRLAFDHPPPSP
ncbi:transposase [Streptomyces sp. NPDC127051]|uniref:transposase n=1 Tax=Streptomyces sp. NPDC127051 TaxID=3347119 RepID=UPI003664A5C9